jgi:peptidoglycan/xylan/chitin deacetylase (PgdA/CDA1 family)
MMGLTGFHFTHKNLSTLFLRTYKILRNYGLSSKQMESNLHQYMNAVKQYAVTPTFPMPADILSRNKGILERFLKFNIDFAIHGNKHVDHTQLSENELIEHFSKAIASFAKHKIPFSGFRFPYLKSNTKCIEALKHHRFKWDSSEPIYWDVIPEEKVPLKKLKYFHSMLNQYNYKKAGESISLPRFSNDLLEIPVSLPDDDLLCRLGINGRGLLQEIWQAILYKAYSRHELFTLQLHPERISDFKVPLVSIIEIAKKLQPPVWIASLNEIDRWWREKSKYQVTVGRAGTSLFMIDVNCSSRALLRIISNESKIKNYAGASLQSNSRFSIRSTKRPVIGLSKGSSQKLHQFLKNEGFIYEVGKEPEEYSIYLDLQQFNKKDEIETLKVIERTPHALIRFSRWPAPFQSALSLTGDIDALSIYDFFSRLSFSA